MLSSFLSKKNFSRYYHCLFINNNRKKRILYQCRSLGIDRSKFRAFANKNGMCSFSSECSSSLFRFILIDNFGLKGIWIDVMIVAFRSVASMDVVVDDVFCVLYVVVCDNVVATEVVKTHNHFNEVSDNLCWVNGFWRSFVRWLCEFSNLEARSLYLVIMSFFPKTHNVVTLVGSIFRSFLWRNAVKGIMGVLGIAFEALNVWKV